jgi:outer membrane immunogenic protein
MKYSFAALGAAVTIASAVGLSSASADGYSRPRAAYAPPAYTSWSGFYIGGHVGAAWSDADWDNVSTTGEPVSNSSSGFIGGGQIGYNQQYGNIVLGVEASLSGTTLSDDTRSAVLPATVTYSTDVNTIVTVTGRLGVAVDQWLLYGKAGWAGAQVDVSGRNTALPDSFSFDDWRNGWTVGAGFEYKLARNISLGLEYSYIDLGSDSFSGNTAAGSPVTVSDHDLQIQSVTARLNFQFYRDRDDYRPLK